MKLCYKKIEFNPNSIYDIEVWEGEFNGKDIHDSYLRGWGFTIVYKDWPNTKIDYTIHYIDTELFTGITKTGHKIVAAADEVRKVCTMYREKVEIKNANIQGSKDIKKLINTLV